MDCGLPVKPCSTSTPTGPPSTLMGSAPGMISLTSAPSRGHDDDRRACAHVRAAGIMAVQVVSQRSCGRRGRRTSGHIAPSNRAHESRETQMAKYPFLSEEWIAEAKAIRDASDSGAAAPAHAVRMNQIITEVPFGD